MPRKAIRRQEGMCGKVRVAKYKGRHWVVYDGQGIVAVTVYRKGAETVARRLTPRRHQAKRRRRRTWS